MLIDSALDARRKVSLAENTSNIDSDINDDDNGVSMLLPGNSCMLATGKKRRRHVYGS
jgi:hypothetical protein